MNTLARAPGGQMRGAELLLFHGSMEFDLFGKLGFNPALPDPISDAAQQLAHGASLSGARGS